MNIRIENDYLYIPTISGEKCLKIEEQDTISIGLDLIDEPKLSQRYYIIDNKFKKDNEGNWYCQIIYYDNADKKFWEFWKKDKKINRIVMSKRSV